MFGKAMVVWRAGVLTRLGPGRQSLGVKIFHYAIALGVFAAAVCPPALLASPVAPTVDSSRVTILGYHRFENPPGDPLAISSDEFEKQMQELKKRNLPVISLDDFLLWKRGEKTLPPESVLITIDDGYVSAYDIAWPILRKFGYPFVMFVYTNYVSVGGKSVTWEQLREMHAAGVAIESHSVSHRNLTKLPKNVNEPYEAWLWHELNGSREIISKKIGTPVRTIAYPYGIFNATVQETGRRAGYEAQFTVYGKKITRATPSDEIGRYVVLSNNPGVFNAAIDFSGSGGTAGVAASDINPSPADGAVIAEYTPLLEADLSSFGEVDPASVELALSGFGRLPATFDPATSRVSYQMIDRLTGLNYTAVVTAKVKGKKVRAEWSFAIDPKMRFESLFSSSAAPKAATRQ